MSRGVSRDDGSVPLIGLPADRASVVNYVPFNTQMVVFEVKGKFAYMSPEQTRGGEMDHRVDLFALGIVIWEALTGKPLFDTNNNLDVVQRVRERRAPLISELRPEAPQALSKTCWV